VTDAPARLLELARLRAPADGTPVVVGIAGAVASGKSTLADAVAREASDEGTAAHVVGTDGFLFSNAVLSQRGLLARKGFPESYDVSALEDFVDAVHAAASDVVVPHYSHEIYDVVPGEPTSFASDAVVVIEGLNALTALAGRLDLGVYLHAEEDDLERWYLDRFRELCEEAATDERSFYRQFASMSFDEIDALAMFTWREVNLVNLREHIAPSRALADVVVVKDSDHRVVEVEVRNGAESGDDGPDRGERS
jgi:type I pantothenate kinase